MLEFLGAFIGIEMAEFIGIEMGDLGNGGEGDNVCGIRKIHLEWMIEGRSYFKIFKLNWIEDLYTFFLTLWENGMIVFLLGWSRNFWAHLLEFEWVIWKRCDQCETVYGIRD